MPPPFFGRYAPSSLQVENSQTAKTNRQGIYRKDVALTTKKGGTAGHRLQFEAGFDLLRANLGSNVDAWFDVIASGNVTAAKKPEPLPEISRGIEATRSTAARLPTVEDSQDGLPGGRHPDRNHVLAEAFRVSRKKLRLWHATASTS